MRTWLLEGHFPFLLPIEETDSPTFQKEGMNMRIPLKNIQAFNSKKKKKKVTIHTDTHTHIYIYIHFKRISIMSLLIEYNALIFIVRPSLILLFRYSIYIYTYLFLCFCLSVVEKGGRTHNPLWLWTRLFLSWLLLICSTCLAAMLLDALRFRIADFPGGPVVKTHLSIQGTWVRSLVWEDSMCYGEN